MGYGRLAREWNAHREQLLQIDRNESLAAAIEFSLDFPTFRKLGPNARDALGAVAFFLQGVDEKNFDWLFSTFPHRTNILRRLSPQPPTERKSLTGSVSFFDISEQRLHHLVGPYLTPRDPMSSLLLHETKYHYITRIPVDVDPTELKFTESEGVTS